MTGSYESKYKIYKMREFLIGIKSLIYMIGFILLWGWVSIYISKFDIYFEILLPAWTKILGIILMILGGILALTCIGVFVIKGHGTPAPFDAPVEFVALGPYRYIRNPMYIGGLLVLIGFGFYEGSISILIFSIIWILFANLFVIYYEEPTLKKRFGTKYEEYCKRIGRWIPNRVIKI